VAEIEAERVTRIFPGGVRAVDEVSLRVRDGEFVALVGPSGCGKTTLLRLVAGLDEATSGTIRIGGRPVNDLPPARRDLAMVFQNYALYPHMTVFENLSFGLRLRRTPREEIDRRVRETARMLGLEELLDRRPRELSGGQRQRVALGRVIVRRPQAFLFDEPLSNLDAQLRVRVRAELKRIHRELGTTSLYVTHDQEEAMTLADRVVVLKDGRVQQEGTPLEIYERPCNRFVASFVGTPPMNFLAGRIRAENGHACFEAEGVRVDLGPSWARRAGRPVVLGIRPEHLSERPPAPAAGTLRARVGVVQPLGDRKDVSLVTPGRETLVGRFDARAELREGDECTLYLDPRRTRFFEPETGEALGEEQGA
jgi:multiple sugar transport system ATP-binding protein